MFLAKEFAFDVYDSLNMKGVSINPNDVSTIMSASPFSLIAPKSGVVRAKQMHFYRLFSLFDKFSWFFKHYLQKNGVTARLTGFENIKDAVGDACPQAFRLE